MTCWGRKLCCLLFAIAFLYLLPACENESADHAQLKEDPVHQNNPIEIADSSPDEKDPPTWGLWYGQWFWDHWYFENVPSPATISPSIATFETGAVGIISTRLVVTTTENGDYEEQALYYSYRTPEGRWQDAVELGRTPPGPTNASIIVSRDGVVNILYNYDGDPIHLQVTKDVVTPFLMPLGPTEAEFNTLAEGPDGRLHAVFGHWGLSHQVFDGKVWTELNTFNKGCYPNLAFGIDGSGHLVYLQPRGLDFADGFTLMHYALAGDQWVGGEVLPDIAFYPDPQTSVDYLGRTHILVPSSIGLIYMMQDKTQPSGWYYEVVAGDSWRTGLDYCDIVTSAGIPIIAYRDSATAKGFSGWRPEDAWVLGEVTGFDGGFVGIDMAVNLLVVPNIVFSGWRLSN